MFKLSLVSQAFCLVFVSALSASATFGSGPAALNANGSVSWSQLGAAGSTVPSSFSVGERGVSLIGLVNGGSGVISCMATSPGGCTSSGFAIATLLLSSSVPEPTTLALLLAGFGIVALAIRFRCPSSLPETAIATILLALALAGTAQRAGAQIPELYQAGDAQLESGKAMLAQLSQTDSSVATPQITTASGSPSLPVWNYRLISPVTGISYGGYMVGQDPFRHGARTTTIPTILVPVIINFHNTTSGFTATFDPSSTPDAGCTAGIAAMDLVENSPIFQSSDWSFNGAHIGTGQYIDAFQRAKLLAVGSENRRQLSYCSVLYFGRSAEYSGQLRSAYTFS